MDDFLDCLGLYRSDVAKDGSCLFRAFSEQLFYTQVHHVKIRNYCVEYIKRHRREFESLVGDDFENYIEKLKDPKEWAGQVEMQALSQEYNVNFVVYNDINNPPFKIHVSSSVKTITLACASENCYDCVYPKSDLSSLAVCQSIVYEVLYKRVFELGSDVDIAVEKMLHDKSYSKQRKSNLFCHLFKENCRIDGVVEEQSLPEEDHAPKNMEIRKALAQGIPPFPYKVAKTLDPGIYRNVEFDMWNEKRKEDLKQEQYVIPKLEPGVKCKVYMNKQKYTGHVQDMYMDNDDVSIYIEELCERCIVSTSILEVMPVPAYKVLTWQGGKTYKVDSETSQQTLDTDKYRTRKGYRKVQEHSPVHSNATVNMRPNAIARSNSLPAQSLQRNSYLKTDNLYSSPQGSRRKAYSITAPQGVRNYSPTKMPNEFPVHQIPNYEVLPKCLFDGLHQNVPSPPIPIPGKVNHSYYPVHPGSPEFIKNVNDISWQEDLTKSGQKFSPTHQQYIIYPEEPAYPGMMPVQQYARATPPTMPLPIPAANGALANEEAPTSPCGPPPVAVYPYPVYAVPGMYVICRDGSPVPVAWSSTEGNEGIPSFIFNTPPTGMSSPVGSWIPATTVPGYGSSWAPASAIAFTPPMEMGPPAYMGPPWSPPYIPPPTAAPTYQQEVDMSAAKPPEPQHRN